MKIKNNFLSKLHLACSDDPIFEKLNLIYFKDGKAHCTNGYIAIIQDLSVHLLTEECIQNLEGKFIHKITFQNLLDYKEVYFKPENIIALTEFKTEVTFNYYKFEEQWLNINEPFDTFSINAIDEIAFNPEFIKKVNECLVKGKNLPIHIRFSEKNRGIIITSVDENSEKQKAILMPAMISNDF